MKHLCDEKEIALKSFFLGPQAENSTWVNELLNSVFVRWAEWRKSLFPSDGSAISESDQCSAAFKARRRNIETVTTELLSRLEGEVPKFSPRYIGHMFSEVSLPALIGHMVTLLHNPNNISGESSRIGTQLEKEAILFLREMIGYPLEQPVGHFTSGGTIANFEALIRAQFRFSTWLASEALLRSECGSLQLDPFKASHQGWSSFELTIKNLKSRSIDLKRINHWRWGVVNSVRLSEEIASLTNGLSFIGPVVLVPEHMHYSWAKGCRMLGIGDDALWPIALDEDGKVSISHLKSLLDCAAAEKRPILMVVSVVGTTELGSIDPVHQIQKVLDDWKQAEGIHIWHHVDAAYGGFFNSVALKESSHFSASSKESLLAISAANSVTLDPHKLGYVPYASGAFLTKEPQDYYFSFFKDAPYLDFDPIQDRGPYTLEGSRSAAGAIATWMSAKTLGFGPDGYGLLLERTVRITKKLAERIRKENLKVKLAPGCDTNILCFTCARDGEEISKSNKRTNQVYEAFSPRRNSSFIVSKTSLQWSAYSSYLNKWTNEWSAKKDSHELSLIRMTLMNPFFSAKEMDVNFESLFVSELKLILERLE